MEPGLRVTGSPGLRFWPGRVGSRVSESDPVFDPVLRFQHARLLWRRFCRVAPSRQTNIRGFGFGLVLVKALLVYLFQLVPVIFTYLRALCPCDVTTFLDLTSFRLLTGSGRVGSRVKNPDPVPSLVWHKQLFVLVCVQVIESSQDLLFCCLS